MFFVVMEFCCFEGSFWDLEHGLLWGWLVRILVVLVSCGFGGVGCF